MTLRAWAPAALFSCLLASGPALAQRAGENAMTSAGDAFGTTVGNESIGLYTSREVRGFDPVQAGNIRLEGLYFDRQSPNPSEILINRIVTGSSIRVGLTAQSYPFPAPTGIADVKMRVPGDKQVTSVFLGFGPYDKAWVEADSQIPIVAEKFSLGVGFGWMRDDTAYGSRPTQLSSGVTARWRPSDDVEIIPFWSRKDTLRLNPRPNIYTAGSFIPPEVPRHVYYAQPWFVNQIADSNYGVIAKAADLGEWTLRAGIFRSFVYRDHWSNALFNNVQQNGLSDHVIIAFPAQEFSSVSGEVRASRSLISGDFKHTVHFAVRGRAVHRVFAGSDSEAMGPVQLGVNRVFPQPTFTFGPQNRDNAQQKTGGVAYDGAWAGVGEMSVGLQKTSYHRTLAQPNQPDNVTRDSPWLYNGTVAYRATPQLAVFASYTNGLEESGEAPNSATNRGEALPAARTSQVDAGIRYAIAPGLSAVATLFQIKKPYFNLDQNRLYTHVGELSHRGLELSLAGKAAEGLTVVAGAVFLKARITGDLVNRGLIGPVPVGRTPRIVRLNTEYGPASWLGVSVDAQLENLSSRVASVDNRAVIPARTTLSLGGRYRFKLFNAPAMLRVQVQNVTDVFGWDINAMQLAFEPAEPRRVTTSLAVDF